MIGFRRGPSWQIAGARRGLQGREKTDHARDLRAYAGSRYTGSSSACAGDASCAGSWSAGPPSACTIAIITSV